MKSQKSHLFKNTVFKKGDESAKTVFTGPGQLEVGPALEFEGNPETLNPAEAEGQVEKQADGFRFTNVEVRAKVTLRERDFAEKVRELGNLAEKYCLVSRSVARPIRYYLKIE